MLLRFRAIQWIRGQRAAFLAFALPLQAGLKIILYHSSWLVERVGPLDVVALQGRLRSFAAERNWERFHSPKNLAMAVASEAGELVDVFQWLTEEESRLLSDENHQRAMEEIADVLIHLLSLADKLEIDLGKAIVWKIELNEQKYPVEVSKGNATKYNRRLGRSNTPPQK